MQHERLAVYLTLQAYGTGALAVSVINAVYGLIYNINPVRVNIVEPYYVLFGGLANGNYPVGLFAGMPPFVIVCKTVGGMIHVRKGLERHIVNGYHRRDIQSYREFV